MKVKYELSIAILWAIAMLSTLWITRDTNYFSYLGPLFFICMLASVIIVSLARLSSNRSKVKSDE